MDLSVILCFELRDYTVRGHFSQVDPNVNISLVPQDLFLWQACRALPSA